MKNLICLAVVAAASSLAGCASGGGGGAPHGPSSSAAPTTTFSSWTELQSRGAAVPEVTQVSGLALVTPYSVGSGGQLQSGALPSSASTHQIGLQYGTSNHPDYLDSQAVRFPGGQPFSTVETMASAGHSEIDVYRDTFPAPGPFLSPFWGVPGQHLTLFANPYATGWDYQSFGVWDADGSSSAIVASTFGRVTPGSAVPASGSATFTGKMAGLFISAAGNGSIATADLAVQADFGNRSLALSTTGMTLSQRPGIAGAASPNLNLSGTMTYSPGSGSFNGTMVTADGSLSGSTTGRFYGPAAEELGGAFAMKSATTGMTMSGAYGAKR